MTRPRTTRGRQTEAAVALYYRDRGFPHAERIPASLPGRDITGMPGLAPEVKARRDFNPLAWIRQARKNASGDVPYVILRCDGQGPEHVGEWLVIRTLEDDTDILRLAGYGDAPDHGHVLSSES
jgi:hypothetical protein